MRDNPLIGQIIESITVSDEKDFIDFKMQNGTVVDAVCEGDCCSKTWIESIDGIEQIIGSKIVSVEDIDMPEPITVENEDTLGDVIQYYGCKITSLIGYATIEYRNSSNGYYGGNLQWEVKQ